MDLYEYQGKDLFRAHGIPAPRASSRPRRRRRPRPPTSSGAPSSSRSRSRSAAAARAAASCWSTRREARGRARPAACSAWVQGPRRDPRAGRAALADIAAEFYASFILDRSRRRPPRDDVGRRRHGDRGGGRTRPDAIRRVHVDPCSALADVPRSRELIGHAAAGGARGRGRHPAEALRAASPNGDATLVEINPLVLLDGRDGGGARRQGHPRRQRAVPPPRVAGAERLRSRSTRARRARRRPACSTWGSTARSGSSATAPGWRCPRSTS